MKKLFGFIVVVSIMVFAIHASAYKNNPDGFRGIKWGTNINTLKDMTEEESDEDFVSYSRENDKLQIGDAKLDVLQYVFWENKLCNILIQTSGYRNFSALKKALFIKFGKGKQKNKYIQRYLWVNKLSTTWILFEYNKHSTIAQLKFYGVRIMKEKDKLDKNKAKKGGKDF